MADAGDAPALATKAGLAENSVIYLDVAAGGLLEAAHLEYVRAWVDTMRTEPYRPVAWNARQAPIFSTWRHEGRRTSAASSA
jgi:hypothetical protein